MTVPTVHRAMTLGDADPNPKKRSRYHDRRPEWNTTPADAAARRIAHFELCDAILRNNKEQAMHALGIIRWSDDGSICEYDDARARLVNPNLIDTEAPDAWEIFRRTLAHSALLHEAVAYSSKMFGNGDDVAITRMLIAKGAMLELTDDSGYTPLHAAAYANNVAACRVLVEAGAQVNARSRRNKTPLHTAAFNNCGDVCDYLVQAGADTNVLNERGETPIEMADALNQNAAKMILNAALLHKKMLAIATPRANADPAAAPLPLARKSTPRSNDPR